MAVRIDVLQVTDCPHLAPTVVRLREALDDTGLSASITEQLIDNEVDARRLGMRGSPTVLIDGEDPFGSSAEVGSVSCRLYVVGDGLDGAPSVAQLIGALTR